MVILCRSNFSADHSVFRSEWSRIKINNQITGLCYYNFKKIPGFVRKSFSLELFNFPSSMDISLTLAARYEISPNLAVNHHSTRIIGILWNSGYSRPFDTSQEWVVLQTATGAAFLAESNMEVAIAIGRHIWNTGLLSALSHLAFLFSWKRC